MKKLILSAVIVSAALLTGSAFAAGNAAQVKHHHTHGSIGSRGVDVNVGKGGRLGNRNPNVNAPRDKAIKTQKGE